MEFQFCPNCGAKLRFPEAEICPSCGVRIRQPPPSPGEIYAGFQRRFLAYLIDFLILAVPSLLVASFFTMDALSQAMSGFNDLLGPLSGDTFSSLLSPQMSQGTISPDMISPQTLLPQMSQGDLGSLLGSSLGSLILPLVEAGVLILLIRWIYFAYFESSPRQATLGKAALGLAVVDGNGKRLSFARASGRWLGKLVSWATLGMGFYVIGFTERKQGLHDIIAGTFVVNRGRLPPE